jgi:hypothetical protein
VANEGETTFFHICFYQLSMGREKQSGLLFVRRLDSSNISKGWGKGCEQHRKEVYDMWLIPALVQQL